MTKNELRKCRKEAEKWLNGNIEEWKRNGTLGDDVIDVKNTTLDDKIQACPTFLPQVVKDALNMMADAGDIGHDQQLYSRYNKGDTIPMSKNIFRACTILGIGMARITGGRTPDLCGLGECDGFWTKPTDPNNKMAVGVPYPVNQSQLSSIDRSTLASTLASSVSRPNSFVFPIRRGSGRSAPSPKGNVMRNLTQDSFSPSNMSRGRTPRSAHGVGRNKSGLSHHSKPSPSHRQHSGSLHDLPSGARGVTRVGSKKAMTPSHFTNEGIS